MRNRFDRQLEELHVELIEMGSMCEDVIRKTSKLLQSGDAKVAKEIRKEDSNIDEQERLVESLCLKLLLQQAAGSERPAQGFRSLKDDHGHGAYRRPGIRYCGDH